MCCGIHEAKGEIVVFRKCIIPIPELPRAQNTAGRKTVDLHSHPKGSKTALNGLFILQHRSEQNGIVAKMGCNGKVDSKGLISVGQQ